MNMSANRPKVLLGIPKCESGDELSWKLSAAGCEIDRAHSVKECQSLLKAGAFELVVLDISLNGSEGDSVTLCRRSSSLLSESHLIFTSTDRPVTKDDVATAISVGAKDVVETPISATTIERLAEIAKQRRAQRRQEGRGDHGASERVGDATGRERQGENEHAAERALAALANTIVGDSAALAAIRQLVLEVAPTRASVMIYGESGTGKELVARSIHRYSKFSNGPFVPVNMSAVPAGLTESLLFGQEKGACTSAVHNQKGWCQAADGGTLFLDEIGDIELQVQPKLLRFLQDGNVEPTGSQLSPQISIRVITATNEDPRTIVSEGRMREDLFFRLHVVPIYVPPLRERPDDIPKLAMLFLRRAAERHDRPVEGFSEEALHVLQQHDWPGNVRQLENTVERLVIFARDSIVEADHIPAEDQLASAYAARRRTMAGAGAERKGNRGFDLVASLTPIERHERAAIVDALRRAEGHVIDAAQLLGLGQATIYRKIKQYAIPHERVRRIKRPK